ncbi:methyl-accepting chemotaxis protein [Domibacillus sp. A3M-37]|uniref:methyl-accepting chemotaxis protein n=1 Tax=Domibacillus sp. A3M-37 TaxID=2962037 RepID=UPI0020B87321|nr:methyl-accepting chemotaxis protein [Domibacillus sp. A3M-37]MCP3764306.1 methyl-accepting chemotaxis protein [Domibacillus sp. A3M-37]
MKKGISLKYQLMLFIFVILATVLIVMFLIAYDSAKDEIIDLGEEMFTNVNKDVIGTADLLNERVEAGDMTLEEAQETFRTYVNGPKMPDGSRDITQTKMSQNDYMFFWAFQEDGVMTMHPAPTEGQNLWDYQVDGKYTVRDTWANREKTGGIYREIWQNEGEPIYTYISHLEYYEPWGWIIGAGGREEVLYERRMDGLQREFLITAILSLIGALAASYFFAQLIFKKINKLRLAIEKASEGDLTQSVDIHFKDEFGHLADSYNIMTGNLRHIVQQVSDASQQVAATSEQLTANAEMTSKSSEQIAETLDSVAAGTVKQLQSIEDTVQAAEGVARGGGQIEENMEKASILAVEASQKAAEGDESLKKAVQQMNSINKTVGGLADAVKGLGENSKEIGQIVQVITGISEQTNLLALNAAIEAARAGESGKGFAVVADEVRKLAEQSKKSAEQITQLINVIRAETNKTIDSTQHATAEVSEGIQVVGQAGESFQHIQESIGEVSVQFELVLEAVKNVAPETEKMVHSIGLVSEVAEGTAASTQTVSASTEDQVASMQEITASAAALSKMSEELHNLVGKFKI